MPHAHILIWLQRKIQPDEIDLIISAEIPNKEEDPLLYEIVSKHMIHGPCGEYNSRSPCMVNGKCNKRFPRSFTVHTQSDNDGYPLYRRRSPEDGGHIAVLGRHSDTQVDNRWVVPHSPVLSRCFSAHINVEYCHSVKAIKYITKYVNKGNDRATFTVQNDCNEIEKYINGRYLSTSEAFWRIFELPIHERYPAVIHLAVHLENGQRVYFNQHNILQVLENPPQTTLTGFFKLCQDDDFAKTLLYCEVPAFYVWRNKNWQRRKRGQLVAGHLGVRKDAALGRVYTVHPNFTECYYLRLLLHHIRGPTSFAMLKTVNSIVQPSYQTACKKLGLIENDEHWKHTLSDAALTQSPSHIRELFAILLVFCQPSDPSSLWCEFKEVMCEDILFQKRLHEDNQDLPFSVDVFNEGLIILEDIIASFSDKRLRDFGILEPSRQSSDYTRDTYSMCDVHRYLKENLPKLVPDQRTIFSAVIDSVQNDNGNLFFIDAPGGTGKTFVINLLIDKCRSERKTVIAVASSGIAATLLKGGRTAHSTFKLPLNTTFIEQATCNVSKNSSIAKVFRDSVLIIWDECTMSNRCHIEAVDRMLRDVRSSSKLMGGVTVVFSGDFRQTLPVIAKGTRADTIKASLKTSPIWQNVKIMTLSTNMRTLLTDDSDSAQFAALLLAVGSGSVTNINSQNILVDHRYGHVVHTIDDLIQKIYEDVQTILNKTHSWFCERVILSQKMMW